VTTKLLPESAPIPLPEFTENGSDDRDSKIFTIIAVGVPTLIILILMSGVVSQVDRSAVFPFLHVDWSAPTLLFANTPTGGDMGAHVLLPQVLRDVLLPSGRIIGWSTAWYAGFPAMYFYFPLPAIFTVIVDVFVPYGVAFKLSTILGLALMPWAVFVMVRGFGFSRVVSGFGAFFGSMFVFMESFAILGGNIKSTLAGEFSFSWSLALSMFYLGVVAKAVREDKPFTPLAGVLLALTALSHIVTTMVVVLATLPLLVRRNGPRTVFRSWGIGFALSAFWAVPLLVRGAQGLTTNMNWTPLDGFLGETPHVGLVATPFPDEFIPLIIIAVIGVVWSLIRRDAVSPLLAMTVFPVLFYALLPEWGITAVYNGRLLPFWFLGGFIFAGIALGLGVSALSRAYPQRLQAMVAVSALALIVPANVALFGVNDAPGWVAWNFTGYEGKAQYDQYDALMQTVDGLPSGRVMWEHNGDINGKYGTPMALMLIPYWDPSHPTMEGVFFESSISTPFHFLNQSEVSESPSQAVRGLTYHGLDIDRAVSHLRLYDVAYYISVTEKATTAAQDAGLEVVAESEPWTIFALPDTTFVDVARNRPVVYAGDAAFNDVAVEWYEDIDGLDYWIASDGPASWPRIETLDERFDVSRSYGGPAGSVSDVVVTDDRIEFTTDAIGRPHLVKMSYFPNWTVTRGGDGPYYAAPSLMIVVPTEERVVLQFEPTIVENVGNLLTLGGIAFLAVFAWQRRKKRRDEALIDEVS
jgi:hypothetical protein